MSKPTPKTAKARAAQAVKDRKLTRAQQMLIARAKMMSKDPDADGDPRKDKPGKPDDD